MNVILNAKFGVSKRNLLLTASLVWGLAAFRVLGIGFENVVNNTRHYWTNILIGAAGAYFFFIFVFFKIYSKHTKRIMNLKPRKYSVFSFFDLKSYIIMAFMIAIGITAKYTNIIPSLYLGTFYITLGGALLSASVSFMNSFIVYKY